MRPVAGFAAAILLGTALAGSAMAQDRTALIASTSKALEDQLSCRASPSPGLAIRAMLRNQMLAQTKFGGDGIPVFRPTADITVFGKKVLFVSGWQAEEDGQVKPPFWRAPGTSPGTLLSVILDASPNTVQYRAYEVPSSDGEPVGPHSSMGAANEYYINHGTEIVCYGGFGHAPPAAPAPSSSAPVSPSAPRPYVQQPDTRQQAQSVPSQKSSDTHQQQFEAAIAQRRQEDEDARALVLEEWQGYEQTITAIEVGAECNLYERLYANLAITQIQTSMVNVQNRAGLVSDRTLSFPKATGDAMRAGKQRVADGACSRIAPADRARMRELVSTLVHP